MAAMATKSAGAVLQTSNLNSVATSMTTSSKLSSCSARFGGVRLTTQKTVISARPSRSFAVAVRAAEKDRIDEFADGVKSDASKNAKNFGEIVSKKADEAQAAVKDVGRDMGAKTQEAIDAGKRNLDQAGDRAQDVGREVKDSTQSTVNAATDSSDGGQTIADKASNAAGKVGNNLKQNFDKGTGAN